MTEPSGARRGVRWPLRAPPLRREPRVLAGNWTGTLHGALPQSVSAPVVLGLGVHRDRAAPSVRRSRAQTELETLLAAQWGDGRIPHIVFNPAVPLDAYFPSPDFWRSSTAGRAAGAPAHRADLRASSSRRCTRSPPGWCTGPTRLSRAARLPRPGLSTAGGLAPLSRRTTATWAEADWPPSCTPGSRAWTTAPAGTRPLARITPAAGPLLPARRPRRTALPRTGPRDLDYGRYVRLAADYRDGGYRDPARGRRTVDTRITSPSRTRLQRPAHRLRTRPRRHHPRTRRRPGPPPGARRHADSGAGTAAVVAGGGPVPVPGPARHGPPPRHSGERGVYAALPGCCP